MRGMVLAFLDGCTYCTLVQIAREALMSEGGQDRDGGGDVVWPRGPRWPRAAQTVWWAARPLSLLEHCRRRYGEVFRIRPYGHGNIVCVAEPELIKQVFTGDRDLFHAG